MLNTTERCSNRSSMAAATIGSSKIFPHEAMPRFVVSTVELLRYRVVMTWKQSGRGFASEREVSHFVDDQQAWSGEEPHGRGPSALERGAVAPGHQIRGSRVVRAVAGVDRRPGER